VTLTGSSADAEPARCVFVGQTNARIPWKGRIPVSVRRRPSRW